jgi:hypothetical protein
VTLLLPILDAAKLCQEIYPVDVPPTVQRDDVRMYVRDYFNFRVIAFGATHPDNLEDLLRDIEARPIDLPDVGTVHEGFGRGAQYIIPDVIGPATFSGPDGEFALIGHSLGGALALVVGAMLAVRGLVARQITTFGAPRPGYAQLGKLLAPVPALRQYRYANDLIPSLPPSLGGGYQHPSDLILLGKVAKDGIGRLSDHPIANYIGALETAALTPDGTWPPATTA